MNKVCLKTLYKQDVTAENIKCHRKYFANNTNNCDKNIYIAWPKIFTWAMNRPCYFTKKNSLRRQFVAHV